jgi:hypothetical protein
LRQLRRWTLCGRPRGLGLVEPMQEIVQDHFMLALSGPEQPIDVHVNKALSQFIHRHPEMPLLFQPSQLRTYGGEAR